MSDKYDSDSVREPRARDVQDIPEAVWRGLVAIVRTSLNSHVFAESFPDPCPDGGAIAGTDEKSFWAVFEGELPGLNRDVLKGDDVPDTLLVLDMVEFLARHVSDPKQGSHHSFYSHHHLTFDPEHGRYWGRDKLSKDVNHLLARNGVVYELHKHGRIVRRSPQPAVEALLRSGLAATIDPELDDLLRRTRRKFLDKDPEIRREALEAAWDAFERIKTVHHAKNKRRGAEKLIAAVTGSAAEAAMIETEMDALTDIGNDFRIRHHETGKAPVTDHLVEPFFARIYAMLHLLHRGVPPKA